MRMNRMSMEGMRMGVVWTGGLRRNGTGMGDDKGERPTEVVRGFVRGWSEDLL